MRTKITVVGMGNVGRAVAQRLAERSYADLVLLDIAPGIAEGTALDLIQAGAVVGYDCKITGTVEYAHTAQSDIVIIASGKSRSPGISREDLLASNMTIVQSVTCEVSATSPNCIIIMVTNPVDAMAYLAYQLTRWPKSRVLGLAGVLDSARFSAFVAEQVGRSVTEVRSLVVGMHSALMVPLTSYSTISGIPITQLVPNDSIALVAERTKKAGPEIFNLLKTTAAVYAPSAAIIKMVDAIIYDSKAILPCSVYLQGEYNVHDLFLGVPVTLGRGGVEEIRHVVLSHEEQVAFGMSAQLAREQVNLMVSWYQSEQTRFSRC